MHEGLNVSAAFKRALCLERLHKMTLLTILLLASRHCGIFLPISEQEAEDAVEKQQQLHRASVDYELRNLGSSKNGL